MSRVAHVLTSKITIAAVVVAVVASSIGFGIVIHDKTNGNVRTTVSAQHQLAQISYDGKTGVNAYALLQKYATIQSKKYSFGEFVTAIDGVTGNGPKYWTLYVNGKEASVGADAYITKSSDRITWRLQ